MVSKNETNELNKYQKKTDKQHILDNPDTYIGSVELVESEEFVHNESGVIIKSKNDIIICLRKHLKTLSFNFSFFKALVRVE